MSETKETIADIVREMREDFRKKRDEWGDYYADKFFGHCNFPGWIDRIEGAAARESKPNPCFYPDTDCQFRMMGGDCCNPCVRGGKPGNAVAIRNCDRFATLAEAVMASGETSAEAPGLAGMGNAQLVRFCKWLFAPCGADGKEARG